VNAEEASDIGRARKAEQIAQAFHESYERLAGGFGYQTRPESAVAWEDVPMVNRGLMVAVAAELMDTGVIHA
jgi:hypothetical protein